MNGDTPDKVFSAETQSASSIVYKFQGDCQYSGTRDAVTRLPNGTGAMLFSGSSCVYVGEWVQGKRSGVGRMVWANGDQYEGVWEGDAMSGGQGEFLRAADGSYYRGTWKSGKPHGSGKAVVGNRHYEGDWAQGALEGQGCFRFDSGSTYDGPWKANVMVDAAKQGALRSQSSESFSETSRRSSVGKLRSSLLLISDFEHSFQVYPKNFKDFLVYTSTLFIVGLGVYLIMHS